MSFHGLMLQTQVHLGFYTTKKLATYDLMLEYTNIVIYDFMLQKYGHL